MCATGSAGIKWFEVNEDDSEASYPQRQAVVEALCQLTGKDGGDDADAWRRLMGDEDQSRAT